jgi:hypothetical protein
MRAVVSFAVGIARFLYRFIFGDDWTVAVVIVLALAATGVLAAGGIQVWWLVPALAILMTGVSLYRSARHQGAQQT